MGRKESLEKIGLIAARFNWQSPVPTGSIACLAQIRASTGPYPRRSSRWRANVPASSLAEPQSAVTPGQVVTIYQDDLVMGGGWIEAAARHDGGRRGAGDNARVVNDVGHGISRYSIRVFHTSK